MDKLKEIDELTNCVMDFLRMSIYRKMNIPETSESNFDDWLYNEIHTIIRKGIK